MIIAREMMKVTSIFREDMVWCSIKSYLEINLERLKTGASGVFKYGHLHGFVLNLSTGVWLWVRTVMISPFEETIYCPYFPLMRNFPLRVQRLLYQNIAWLLTSFITSSGEIPRRWIERIMPWTVKSILSFWPHATSLFSFSCFLRYGFHTLSFMWDMNQWKFQVFPIIYSWRSFLITCLAYISSRYCCELFCFGISALLKLSRVRATT